MISTKSGDIQKLVNSLLGATMHQPDYSAVHAYRQARSTEDPLESENLIQSCWTEEGEIVVPEYRFKGIKAVIDEIQRFRTEQSGCNQTASMQAGSSQTVELNEISFRV